MPTSLKTNHLSSFLQSFHTYALQVLQNYNHCLPYSLFTIYNHNHNPFNIHLLYIPKFHILKYTVYCKWDQNQAETSPAYFLIKTEIITQIHRPFQAEDKHKKYWQSKVTVHEISNINWTTRLLWLWGTWKRQLETALNRWWLDACTASIQLYGFTEYIFK
jgi:hypothetical protein